MGLKGFYKRYENKILASVLLLALLLFVGIRYDYYYDLNDDVVMKDILSGVYTGVPEGHNIQMLYPLSFGISLLYRIFPKAPVYGIFLCLCQYGSIWLAVGRSLQFGRDTRQKAAMALAEGAVLVWLLLPHLVFVQYTFASAVLTAAAAFLFITSGAGGTGRFILRNVPSVLLAVLAYMLRTEMFLLLLPLVCVAGMYRWSLEGEIFTKENGVKYLAVIGGILLGMLAAWGINGAAFGSREWKEYVEFFNSRTELYDFQGLPSYQGNEGLYGSLGLTEREQDMLLEQYNFGLEDTLGAGDLDRISKYQVRHRGEKQTFSALFLDALKLYRYRSFHKEPAGSAVPDDFPWNLLVAAGYVLVFLVLLADAVGRKDFRWAAAGVGKLIFLFCVRTVLWMFLLIRGRDPVRITHSLYWMEFCMLSAMLYVETAAVGLGKVGEPGKRERPGKVAELVKTGRPGKAVGMDKVVGLRKLGRPDKVGCLGKADAMVYIWLVVAAFVVGLGDRGCIADTDKEYQARAVADTVDKGMKEYSRGHSGNFYFFDVYSAVSYPLEPYASTPYSEKMFVDVDNSLGNYDIMGGWLVKSPSYQKKLQAFGMVSMKEALLYQENVYMMAELAKGTDAFEAYFREQGVEAELELADTVCDIIGVYGVKP